MPSMDWEAAAMDQAFDVLLDDEADEGKRGELPRPRRRRVAVAPRAHRVESQADHHEPKQRRNHDGRCCR